MQLTFSPDAKSTQIKWNCIDVAIRAQRSFGAPDEKRKDKHIDISGPTWRRARGHRVVDGFEHAMHISMHLTFPILRGGKVGMTNEEKAAVRREEMDETSLKNAIEGKRQQETATPGLFTRRPAKSSSEERTALQAR